MPPPARNGDMIIGVCPCHKRPQNYQATWVAASTVITEGQPRVNLTHIAISSCGHPVVALTGSATVFVDGSPSHRVNDLGQNCGMGTTITGAATVITGG